MLLFILISVFPFPDGNDVFVGLSIMILPVLLILRQYQVLMITVGMGALHIVLAIMFKNPSTLGHDIFETIAAVLLSEAISLPVFNLRLSNFSTQQELKRISSLDSLTGIFNRSSIENEAKQFLEGKIVPSGWAIAMLDIDCFKKINDVYGHKQGDDVLSLLGQKLKVLQSESIFTGRIGGDEFMILFKAKCDRNQISNSMESFRKDFAESSAKELGISATLSIGALADNGSGMTYLHAFTETDKALYYSKSQGKNTVSVF